MSYLFISGAPRSGTSALTELISSHSNIAIGMERFKFLYGKNLVEKEVFSKDSFFNFKEEQTNIHNVSGKYVDYYNSLEEKYERCSIVGDKYPQLYKSWDKLFNKFENDAKYIHIVRDIEDVASSFNVRAQKPNDKWPAKNDYKKAVEIWNESLDITEEAINSGKDICVVSYTRIFDTELFPVENQLKKIFKYLGVEIDKEISKAHIKMSTNYVKKNKV